MIKKYIFIDLLSITTLVLVSQIYMYPNILTSLLFIIAVIILLILKSKFKILIFILCGIFGSIAEIIAIYFGAWSYNESQFIGINYWLPFLWGIASLFMISLENQIKIFLKIN